MVDTRDLKSLAVGREGSSPSLGTTCGYGGIGRPAGLRNQCLERASSSLAIRTIMGI